jgi:phosphohistidine phosphatase
MEETAGREPMELLIVRHAIAFERDRQRWRDDDARPLSPAGIRQSRKAAAGLKEISKAPDRLLTSSLVRARQTAQILTDVAGWPQAEEVRELLPGQAALAVLTLLGKDRNKRVAIVGHQPGLGALITACLLGEDGALTVDMKKNAVACVSFEGSPRAGHAVLKWLATPRILRGLRRD